MMNLHYGSTSSLHSFLTATLQVRKWERANVPFLSPQIAFDIAVYAAALRLEQRQLSSKNVQLTVGHSADRVREVLSELVAEGWIERLIHPHDRRIRLIRATDRLLDLLSDYAHHSRAKIASHGASAGAIQAPTPLILDE